jgi:hypothetical protein
MHIMARMVLAVTLVLLVFTLHAQDEEAEDSEPDQSLDLFDGDVEETGLGWAQFTASAGLMYLDADGSFTARLPDGRVVTIIDFDRAGLDETDSSYWLSLAWRSSSSRWGAWFGSWRYDVTGSNAWEGSLPLGNGVEIPAGASVTSEFDAQWYILEATYSFFRTESVDAGIGIGAHVVDLDTAISAEVRIGDREVEVISGDLDALAPLPNLLLYVYWKMAPRWNLTARAGYFTLDYDKYSGSMSNANAMVNYSLTDRWALGAAYHFIDLDLDIDQTEYVQVYDIQFAGPMVFARFRF